MIQGIAKFLTNPLLYIWIGLMVSFWSYPQTVVPGTYLYR